MFLKFKHFMEFKSSLIFYQVEILNDLWSLTWTFNFTPLIHASKYGYKEIVELLLKQEGIDVNIRNNDIWINFFLFYGISKNNI